MSKLLDEDMKTVKPQGDQQLLEQLSKPEVQESLTVLIEQLPRLTEVLITLADNFETVKSLATDEILKEDTMNAVKEFARPAIGTAKKVAQNVMEAKELAEENNEVIGVFGLMKLLKEPQVQKMLRFIQAYLQVSAQKKE